MIKHKENCPCKLHSIEFRQAVRLRRLGKPTISGINHWNWKGGITKLSELIRKSRRYVYFRNKIFERDDYTCKLCNIRGAKINLDHYPTSFSKILRVSNIKSLKDAYSCGDLWREDNVRTLCLDCHRKTETYGTRSWTQEDIDKFKIRMREINKGRLISEETRKKLSISHLGHKQSEETKRKISLANIGNKRALGTIVPLERRERISLSLKRFHENKKQKDKE